MEENIVTSEVGQKVLTKDSACPKLPVKYRIAGFCTCFILGFILMAIAIGFFVPVLIDYLETGLVAKFPTLIVCGFVGLSAVHSFFAGMIMSDINIQDRRTYEFRRNLIQRDLNQDQK